MSIMVYCPKNEQGRGKMSRGGSKVVRDLGVVWGTCFLLLNVIAYTIVLYNISVQYSE